jgi:hypothetical protein
MLTSPRLRLRPWRDGDLPAFAALNVGNARSRKVMERLGMTYSPDDDFDHPRIPEGHRIRPHVLYRTKREAWKLDKEVRCEK